MPAQFLAAVLVISKLVALKSAVMSADYRGDISELAKLRSEASQLSNDPKLGYLADYWSGYASWRIVLNGMGTTVKADQAQVEVARGAEAFESSIRKKSDFADAYVGDAAMHGLMAALKRSDAPAMNAEIAIFQRQIKRALELQPNNPRALWVQAIPYLVLPKERGGNIDHAIELYRQMLNNATPLDPTSPFPDWGKVEGLMSLANAHIMQMPPNFDAANAEVKEILGLQPDWHYVRDILTAQVEAKAKPLHDFDYLLGDWEFTGTNQQFGSFHGYWSASRLGDGMIFDEYRVTGDHRETYYVTQTIRSYNFKTNQWELVSTEKGGGLQNRGTGVREGGEVHIEQMFGATTASPSLLRIRYYDIQPDHFSWTADRSNDNGKTWVTGYQQMDVKRVGPERPLALTAANEVQH